MTLLVMGISIDRTCTCYRRSDSIYACVYVCIYLCIHAIYDIDTLWTSKEKFFTLYRQSALKSRPMERSAGTDLPRLDTFAFSRIRFHSHQVAHTHSRGER